MDIYIKWNNDKSQIQLPVLPDAFEIGFTNNNESMIVHNLGEINLKGKRNLYTIAFSSFFPDVAYDFYRVAKPKKPYDYVKDIKKLFDANETVHIIISGTNVNMYCTIEEFVYGQQEKTNDVYYSLNLKQFREVKHTSIKKSTTKNTKVTKATTKRPSKKIKSHSYKWKKGDTWNKVAKKETGSSANGKALQKLNKKTITSAKKAYKKKHPKTKTIKEAVALVGYKVVIKI